MENDARKISLDAQREKRQTALRMWQQAYTQKAIAEACGVHLRTVAEWIKIARGKGLSTAIEGGQRGRQTGAGRSLSAEQELMIKLLIVDKMPDQLKLTFALWTRDAVRELIRVKCGFLMPIRTVGEYLSRWGYTPQRPLKRAYQQDPERVDRWLKDEYPAINKRAKQEGGEIQWGDETGLRSDSHAGRSYSPAGQTPVRMVSGSRFSTNMISTVTNRGKLRFMLYRETLTAKVLLKFFKRLVKESERKIFLILDNLRVHHAKLVRAWLEEHKQEIEVFYLPPYAPELNPDEYLNGDLKQQIRTGRSAKSLDELESRLRSVLKRLQLRPNRIASYFKHPKIAYASDMGY
jgi:transposase